MKIVEYLRSKFPDIQWAYQAEMGIYTGTLGNKSIAFIKDDKPLLSKPGMPRLYDYVNQLRQAQ